MRVTFRAQFQGPKSLLNPLGMNCTRLQTTVEIFRKADNWLARETASKNVLKLQSEPTHGAMKDTVAANFETQLSAWSMFDSDGGPLDPNMVEEDPQGNFTARELTHVGAIANAGVTGPLKRIAERMGANYFQTACGITVHVTQIRSVRGKHPPTCQECRKTWEKTPEEQRLK